MGEIHPDSYYEDCSRVAIEQAMEECEGLPLEDQRFILRRSFPFGPLRKEAKGYKTWNRLVSEQEKKLGIASRTHKDRILSEPAYPQIPKRQTFILPDSYEALLQLFPRPKTEAEASRFLRQHTRSYLVMMADHDVFRVVMKQQNKHDHSVKFEVVTELRTDDQKEWSQVYIEAAQEVY